MKRVILMLAVVILPALVAHASEPNVLRLIILPSIREYTWNSPRTALFQSLRNAVIADIDKEWKPHDASMFGHMVVNYSCSEPDGTRHEVFSGMSGQNEPEEDRINLLDKKLGLTVLFLDYKDAEVQDADNYSQNRVVNYFGRIERNSDGKVRRLRPKFIGFPITPAECREIHEMHAMFKSLAWDKTRETLEHFRARPEYDALYYGNNFRDPQLDYLARKAGKKVKLGAGCTAFGTAFAKLTGNFDPIYEKLWLREFEISEDLLGGEQFNDRKVSPWKLIFTKLGSKWAHPGYATHRTGFYDPEKVWDFIDGVQSCAAYDENGVRTKTLPKNCTPEVLFWLRDHWSRVSPQVSFTAVGAGVGGRTTRSVIQGIEVSK